jgi:hypothetical protein
MYMGWGMSDGYLTHNSWRRWATASPFPVFGIVVPILLGLNSSSGNKGTNDPTALACKGAGGGLRA